MSKSERPDDKLTITIEKKGGNAYEFYVKRECKNPLKRYEFGVVGPKKEALAEVQHYLFIFTKGENNGTN